jgi:hypothetical protein
MSLEARSGNKLRVLGIPARKEWQDTVSTPGIHMSLKSPASSLLKCDFVRFEPDAKRNTGMSKLKTPSAVCFLLRAVRALTGQQL